MFEHLAEQGPMTPTNSYGRLPGGQPTLACSLALAALAVLAPLASLAALAFATPAPCAAPAARVPKNYHYAVPFLCLCLVECGRGEV